MIFDNKCHQIYRQRTHPFDLIGTQNIGTSLLHIPGDIGQTKKMYSDIINAGK
jgi:hypothetical protein